VVQIPPSDGTSSVLLGHCDHSGFHHEAENGTGVILIYSNPIPLV
jgi:hypothetical protein